MNIDDLTAALLPETVDVPVEGTDFVLTMSPMSMTDQLKITALVRTDKSDITRIQATAIIACSKELKEQDLDKVMCWNKETLSSLSEKAYTVSQLNDSATAEKN